MRVSKYLTISLISFWIIHCTNPFSVREAKPPNSQSGSEFYSDATGPDTVFVNLQKSIKNKNVPEYMDVFVNPDLTEPHAFYFEPERYFQNDFIQPWTLEDEQNYFNQLKNSGTADYPELRLDFKNKPELSAIISGSDNDSLQSNSIEYALYIDYGDSTLVYSGVSEFKLFKSQNNQLWYIYYWRDNAVNQNYNSTWTFLKTKYK